MAGYLGYRFGNYRLVKLLGEGGFAEVYLAEHVHLGTHAAVKILTTKLTDDEIAQFRNEARIIIDLDHPNIVRVLDFGMEGRIPFLVMAYAPHGSLRRSYPKGARLPLSTIVTYVKQIANSLEYVHAQKLIHRDIKPENMLIGRNGEIWLSDFGIAVAAHHTSSLKTQDGPGTIYYMAPEQIQGKPRPASDQYSLAIVVYEWLCGARPFTGTYWEIITQHLSTPPPPFEKKLEILSDVEQVVMTALNKDPKQRFTNVQAFSMALEYISQLEFVPTILSSNVSLTCPRCGFQNQPGVKFCRNDGHLLTERLAAVSPKVVAESAMLPLGTVLYGRYRIEHVLGSGGFGHVYLAVDLQTNQQYALKEYLVTEASGKAHWEHEARVLSHLHHPNLPTFQATFDERGRYYLQR